MENITLSKKSLILVLLLQFISAIGFAQSQPFTSDGTFVVPAGVTSITVEAWGGGGRGATRSSNGGGGGGGGGAYCRRTIAVTPGDSFAVTIGLGSNSTATGGNTSFVNNATTTTMLLARGGNTNNNATAGATGGTASFGDVNYTGGTGAAGSAGSYGGGGGSSAGPSGAGAVGSGSTGGSVAGGGDGGDGRSGSQGDGLVGGDYGGGGGGALRTSSGTRNGGNGANGYVMVSWPEINLQGNATSIVSGDPSPTTTDWTDFGSSAVGVGITRTFTIQNTGVANLTVGAISFSGTNAADFSVTTSPAASVAGAGSTTFVVTFTPSASGTRTATISIVNNDGNENPYTFAVQGSGLVQPEMDMEGNGVSIVDGDITPSTTDATDFGSVDYSAGTIPVTYTIYNTGSATLNLGAITIAGTNPGDFTVTTSPAATVAPGGSTTLVITFNPSASGTRNATFSIVNNDSNENPYNFSIRGTGTDPEINVQGNATTIADGDNSASASDWTIFGSTDITYGTLTRTFTIQNTGTATLTISGTSITGTNAGDFAVTTAPPASIAAGSSATFVVTFDPSATGTRNATLNIFSNDVNEATYDFAIQGTGTDPEMNMLGNATSITDGDTTPTTADWTDFGSTYVSGGTFTRTFTIQHVNTGTGTLNIGAITFSGANASDFTVTTAPGSTTLNSNTTTTFVVTFNPSGIGLRSATISIANNDANENPYDFAIQGTGTEPEINVTGNATSIVDGDTTPSTGDHTDFGTTDIAAGTIIRTFTIQNLNTATTNLLINSVTITGANAADFTISTAVGSTSIAANGSTTFQVTFNPSAVGVRNATINITTNDSDESPYDFAISGTGADPEIEVRGNSIVIVDGDTTPSATDHTDYGNVEYTSAVSTRTYTIYNTGTMALTLGAITFSGGNSGDFSATALGTTSLAVGASVSFTVTFNPSAVGTRSTTLNIANNDSNENPYNFSIQGYGTNPEINLVGNLISIANADGSPSVSDNTDFGTVSIDAGSTLVTYTIQNTGSTGVLNIGAISFTGANASDFTVTTAPASTVAASGSTTFIVSFNPTSVGVKTATIYIVNDDANENPYYFSITGLGVRTYADTDGDNVSDNYDIDDDNDGIPDTTEQSECILSPLSGSTTYTFLNETFGTGTTKGLININIPGATCTYCYEDGVVGPNTAACPSQSSWILDDGEYVVVYKIAGTVASDPENIHGDLAWNGLEDHTPGDTNGRMAVFNASFTPGTFYETTITGIIPNVPVTYSFWVLNIMSTHNYSGSILPDITVEFIDPATSTVLSTYNTGQIGRCNGGIAVNTCTYSEWQQYTTTINLGTVTTFTIRFKNNAPGGGGNDLAIDDITLRQQYCDRDGDTIADIFDLDSDNDGIPDIEEAGFKALSSGKATIDRTLAAWTDANANGLVDSVDSQIAGGTYSIPDSDGDGVKDFHDLDSDNDAMFDVDESNLYNGDGDINGDGFGDGVDTDKDGILDLYDTSVAFGTNTRPYADDTDNDGIANYREIDANTDGVKDILSTLYGSFDANLDGMIDGTTDVDKDGIRDSFDTKTTAMGSPRDLNRKLYLDFDGRNDYGEAPQYLSGLSKSTIMCWIKLTNPYSATGYVIGQDNFSLRVDTSSGSPKVIVTAKGGVYATYNTALVPDRWYHICAVYDGTVPALRLYINGKLEVTETSGTLAGTLATSTAKFTLGKIATSSANYFKGSIDEVRIFNTALTTDQIQKMVYQEIKQQGTQIRGEIIPKNIESTLWFNLLGYFRMDAYKDDVIDNIMIAGIDNGINANYTKIYNNKLITYQLAPMPFVTTQSSALETAVSQNNYVNGTDLFLYDWSILQIKHNINLPYNLTGVGLFIDPSITVNLTNDNKIQNTWYMRLDGKLDLQGRSQLVQTGTSDLETLSAGYIERDQQGQTNKWNYNYWASPVGAIGTGINNAQTVAGIMKDGTNPASPQNLQWTSGLNSIASTPITLSSYWIFKFQNVSNSYANWSSVGPNGALSAGQGFTLKGSNALTPTQNYTFVGKPNNATTALPVNIPIAANNLNLCGNPFPSAIDANQFITDNLSSLTGTLYIWEHFSTNTTHVLADYQGGYATRTLVGGTPPVSPSGVSGLGSSTKTPGRFIPVGQGFFVTANTTGGTITFNNNQRAFVKENDVNSTTLFRQSLPVVGPVQNGGLNNAIFNNNEDAYEMDEYARIRIGYNSANHYHRQVLLGFMDEHASAGIDPGYDALHIDSQPNDMYFMNSNVKFNIQGDGFFNTSNIYPIGVKNSVAGAVTFTLDGIENFDENQKIYIYDNQTGIYHDITEEPFGIELPSGTNDTRFSLRFMANTTTSLGTSEVTLENGIFVAYTNDDSIINIKNNVLDATVSKVSLYNMIGQSIASWDVKSQDQQDIQIPVQHLATGTYIVKIKTTKGDLSKKIIIK